MLAIPEAKRRTSFWSAEKFFEGCHSPYRLDISHKSGGSLVYVEAAITSCQLSQPKFWFKMQASTLEI